MSSIGKQQRVVSSWTHWERVPVSSDGRVQEVVDLPPKTLFNVASPINYLWMNFKHCRHDTTDSDGSEGVTNTMPNTRAYTTATYEEDLDVMVCRKNIKVPRGMMGICARSECPHYEPIDYNTWDIPKYSSDPTDPEVKVVGKIHATSGSGYLCEPITHDIRYTRKNPDDVPDGSWTAFEIINGSNADSLGQRKIWTYWGGGNIVGRHPWMNIRTGEIGYTQWTYQRVTRKYDVLNIISGTLSGQSYMVARALPCYAHHSDYQTTGSGSQSAFPTDILNPTMLNLPYSGSEPSISSDFFKLDYLEIYNVDGSAIKTDIPVGSDFEITSHAVAGPHEEFPIRVYEIVDKIKFDNNTFGSAGDIELTKGTHFTADIINGKITFESGYQAQRVAADPPERCYRIEYGRILRESIVSKATMEEIQTLILNADTLRVEGFSSEEPGFVMAKMAKYDLFSDCASGTVEQHYRSWSDFWYQRFSDDFASFNDLGYVTKARTQGDRIYYYEGHKAKVFILPWVPFGIIASLGGTITSAIARIRMTVTSATKETYGVQARIPGLTGRCFNGELHDIPNSQTVTASDITTDIPVTGALMFKRQDRMFCMNQQSIGVDGCLLTNRPFFEQPASNCESRPSLAESYSRKCADWGVLGHRILVDSYDGTTYYNKLGKAGTWFIRSYAIDGSCGTCDPSATDSMIVYPTFNPPAPTSNCPPHFLAGIQCFAGRTYGGTGGYDFYVEEYWTGIEQSGNYNIISTAFPSGSIGGSEIELEVDITGAINYWLSKINEQQTAGIMFSSEWLTSHHSTLDFGNEVVDDKSIGPTWSLEGFTSSIIFDVELDDIEIVYSLPDDVRKYRVHSEHHPKKLVGGS